MRDTALSRVAAAFAGLLAVSAAAQDNIGHDRHRHHHNPKHPTVDPTPARFITSRASEVVLPLPEEKDAFVFAVFGDRTGGPVDGVKVLADAVRDVNLLEPDLVMTVGDLINGYNAEAAWLEQMLEYRDHGRVAMPVVPCRREPRCLPGATGRPPEAREELQMRFARSGTPSSTRTAGSSPSTATRPTRPASASTSRLPADERGAVHLAERRTLAKAAADHVFLFLHHPRWLGGQYGDDGTRFTARWSRQET